MYAGIRYWWYEGAPREQPVDGPPRRDDAPGTPREPFFLEGTGQTLNSDRFGARDREVAAE